MSTFGYPDGRNFTESQNGRSGLNGAPNSVCGGATIPKRDANLTSGRFFHARCDLGRHRWALFKHNQKPANPHES
ncbi:hypothetical protein [Massilia sp. PWRC2]|uniref:hypothetical protein n=1 Tax=Massilia sp. PWRC2 TaxID=2804626 RepID=UPI003CFAD136